MKHLLTGVAIAAALAISAPAWAQNAPAPMKPAAAPAKPAAAGPKKPMPKHHYMHHRMGAPDDAMTEQLNKQELARIEGGAPPPGAPAPGTRLPGPKASPQ